MRQPILVFALTLLTASACLFSPDLVKPAEPIPTATIEETAFQIQGHTFLEANQDGVFDPAADSALDGVRVELFSLSDPETPVQSTTSEDGEYRFELEQEGNYFLQFTPSQPPDTLDFTEQAAGDDAIDSDVDDTGTTESFRAGVGFSRVLSAGFINPEPAVATIIQVEDQLDDCRSPGQETEQPCAADIHSCAINTAGAPASFRLICFVDQFQDPGEFDLYIGLNLDADPATGIQDESRQGVDAELYANGQANYVNFSRYDSTGVFLDTVELEQPGARLSFQADEEIQGGVLMVDIQLDDELRAAIPPETEVTFRAIHFAASGAHLHDDTRAVGDVFLDHNPVSDQTHIVHTVKEGETVVHISPLYGVPVEIILTVNETTNSPLTVGQKLFIPKEGWD